MFKRFSRRLARKPRDPLLPRLNGLSRFINPSIPSTVLTQTQAKIDEARALPAPYFPIEQTSD
jgi:hypothetical protein